MKPLGQRVLVKRAVNTEQRRGLIWIPEKAKSIPQEGDVIAVGDHVTTLKPGDRILFGRYQGTEVEVKGEKYVVLWSRDVMAVLE